MEIAIAVAIFLLIAMNTVAEIVRDSEKCRAWWPLAELTQEVCKETAIQIAIVGSVLCAIWLCIYLG